MEFELRRAARADLADIMALETSTFENDAWSAASMSSELGSIHTYYLVAFDSEHPEELAGYAGLLAPTGSRDGEVQTIAVAQLARRHGLGRILMERLIAEADARGARQVFLEVRADNPNARALYDSLGFEQIAVRRNYYQPDNVDAQVMRLTLPGLVSEPVEEALDD
jgi:[ribosomal protein S18]-alanine N-acetyltransferase